ncbi:MAG: TadE/TadG family type IV pilus assembly protein [Pseudomonadota bacterium]
MAHTIQTPSQYKSALLRRFASEDGATAVEFALVAPPFFFLIFGLLEVSLIFFMSVVLEHGTQQTARLVRTGQIEKTINLDDFRTEVCSQSVALPDCENRLSVDVQVVSDFENTSMDLPVDGAGNLASAGFAINVGNANEIVVVRAFYIWPLITPLLSTPLSNVAGNNRLLVAAEAMKNEPF